MIRLLKPLGRVGSCANRVVSMLWRKEDNARIAPGRCIRDALEQLLFLPSSISILFTILVRNSLNCGYYEPCWTCASETHT